MQVGDEIQATLGGIYREFWHSLFLGDFRWRLATYGGRSVSGIPWTIET